VDEISTRSAQQKIAASISIEVNLQKGDTEVELQRNYQMKLQQ
jgi:hypothetical protein